MRRIRASRTQVPDEEIAELLKLGVRVMVDDEDSSDSGPGENEVLNDGNGGHYDAELTDDDEVSDDDDELSDDDDDDDDEAELPDYGVERSDDNAELSDDAKKDALASSKDDESSYTSNEEERTVPENQQHDQEDDAQQREADPYNGQTIEGIDDVEVAEILKEAARVNGLEDCDVWFAMIVRPDPRLG